ncbi:hypothetical protein SMACR_02213 [Sordaria macrospora]|uniref:WGS project CABT00000000 data, contig 2.23 n=2 Tax=Sordaria macrospora TaxID=5147 RepID=F7W2Y9_SORMK|nr:uncharacterized protein SMAC_02213 [Sordaria macrospora k-hell]KAA8632090.1 hypothetical protein SMACR_02213 [Sordaria macrospora]KAH7629076.1 hypothetical protein B0T09DRAFT_358081 [Sordaria sp. MPI-SDFR-AT-0083]CCC11991.1 unnamed protein product [Sordaria macrospora k-hell]
MLVVDPTYPVVSFNKTSSPELKEALETLREKVILPTYLPPELRQKIFNKKYEKELAHDPVTIQIDGQPQRFTYINMMTDMPNTPKNIRSALLKMKDGGDFANLSGLLEGMQRANRKLPYWLSAQIVRKACKAGQLELILRMVRDVKRTGFTLDRHETVNELLHWIQRWAWKKDYSEPETRKALKEVQEILEALEGDERHMSKDRQRQESLTSFPYYSDPQFLVARLNLAAELAARKVTGTQDAEQKLTSANNVKNLLKYAKQLVKLWPADKALLDMYKDEAYVARVDLRYIIKPQVHLRYASFALQGLKRAAEVVGKAGDGQMAAQLINRATAVEAEAQLAYAKVEDGMAGQKIYEMVVGGKK